jgi:hypothetical protein
MGGWRWQDILCLGLWYRSAVSTEEIQRGAHGQGNYSVSCQPCSAASSSIKRKSHKKLNWVSGALVTVLFLDLTGLEKETQFDVTGTASPGAPDIICEPASELW